ncbi:hypothetical protein Glove_476g52 [Diversispora epigaea]|uniref:Uncharacterized protein n=1 Tax=Diversispora epigaea TaxID=1348612 RepID=A0A397GKW9_9GLOM|nr:hypothetical protein Glove_476g52 [Diversispora epigaea]
MNNLNDLLANINRTLIFPLSLSTEEVILLFNSKRPFRKNKDCHGYMLFRISVAKECQRLGENNKMIITSAANYFWKNSTKTPRSALHNVTDEIISVKFENKRVLLLSEIEILVDHAQEEW